MIIKGIKVDSKKDNQKVTNSPLENYQTQPRITQMIKLVDKDIKRIITIFHIFKNPEKRLTK